MVPAADPEGAWNVCVELGIGSEVDDRLGLDPGQVDQPFE